MSGEKLSGFAPESGAQDNEKEKSIESNNRPNLEESSKVSEAEEVLSPLAGLFGRLTEDVDGSPASHECIASEKWEETTTDPNSYDPNDYCFIVHAIQNDPVVRIMQNLAAIEMGGHSQKTIDVAETPERISEKPIMSCSIIGKREGEGGFNAQSTWARVGVILKVPRENIVRSGTQDLGSNFVNSEEEVKKYVGLPKGDPEDVLRRTMPRQYNEVVVQGETEKGGKVEIVGVFLNEHDSKPTEEEKRLAALLQYRTSKPLVVIEKEEIKLDDKPIHVATYGDKNSSFGGIRLSEISFTKDNREYSCNLAKYGGLRWGIYATGEYGDQFVSDPEVIEVFMEELKNLSEEDKRKYGAIIDLIPAQYEIAKKVIELQRSKPEEADRLRRELSKYDYIIEGVEAELNRE